ncbi:MAG: hypothetical protein RL380_1448, partial [Verrucomicrobiota bacterium]
MKTQLPFALGLMFASAFTVLAQTKIVVSRGADYKVWARVHSVTNPAGGVKVVTNRYTELATGMHYQQNGQWKESQAEITLLPPTRLAISHDETGIFGGDLLVVARTNGMVWRLKANGEQLLLTNLSGDFESLLVIPNNLVRYGNDFAGKLLVGSETGGFFTIEAGTTNTASFGSSGINVEDIGIVPPGNQYFYCADVDRGRLFKVSYEFFTNEVDRLMITDETGAAGLHFLDWGGSQFIQTNYYPYLLN